MARCGVSVLGYQAQQTTSTLAVHVGVARQGSARFPARGMVEYRVTVASW